MSLRVLIFLSLLASMIGACAVTVPSATQSGPRTLILDDTYVSEAKVGGFTCWYCKDYFSRTYNLVEVGFFNNPDSNLSGFILYDDGFEGTKTLYSRKGLIRRWDWGFDGEGYTYAFVLKPDGTGLYYDFSLAETDESIDPKEIYKCYQRKTN